MFILSFINLPKEIVSLCKLDMNSSNAKILTTNILKKNAFIQMSMNKDLEIYGWQELRNRLSELYLSKLLFGHYINHASKDLVDELKKFEDHFYKFTINGFSRVFLLGLFLKMHNIQLQDKENNGNFHFELHPKIIDLLKISKVKIVKIDYLILLLHHLIELTSFEMTYEWISSKLSFDEIFVKLSPDIQRVIHHNFLSYSSSISEPDFFIYNKV